MSPWMVPHHCSKNPLPAACSACSMQCAVFSTRIFNMSLLPPSQWQWQPAIPEPGYKGWYDAGMTITFNIRKASQ